MAGQARLGRSWPGSEVRILDDEDNDLPPNTVDTIYMSLAVCDFEQI